MRAPLPAPPLAACLHVHAMQQRLAALRRLTCCWDRVWAALLSIPADLPPWRRSSQALKSEPWLQALARWRSVCAPPRGGPLAACATCASERTPPSTCLTWCNTPTPNCCCCLSEHLRLAARESCASALKAARILLNLACALLRAAACPMQWRWHCCAMCSLTTKLGCMQDLSSAHYDPKSRSMREDPQPSRPDTEKSFKGDNFVRKGGDFAVRTRHIAWAAVLCNAAIVGCASCQPGWEAAQRTETGQGWKLHGWRGDPCAAGLPVTELRQRCVTLLVPQLHFCRKFPQSKACRKRLDRRSRAMNEP